MALISLRLRTVLNSTTRRPLRTILGLAFAGLAGWGMFELVAAGIRLIDGYPAIDTIADAVLRRSLEGLFLVLMAGVAFSSITGAVSTLYYSEDLPFLLAQPVPAWRVFGLKLLETYATSALLPAFLTVPVLLGIGAARSVSPAFTPLALASVLALYAIPVAIGSLLALALMRIAPAGRVREVATAVSVLLAAGMIFGLRLLRPEQLAAMSPEQFEQLLAAFSALEVGWLPSTWAADGVWAALGGGVSPAAWLLLALAMGLLGLTAWLAAVAYREGWIRGMDATRLRLDGRPRRAAAWERLLPGRIGAIIAKDLRLTLRDPGQWSQLLVLAALAGVYLIGVGSIEVGIQPFRDVLGALNLVFIGFMLAGVGMRLALPLVSLEGEGWWLLRTGPLTSRQVVVAKFLHALPPLLLLGVGLGAAVAWLVDMSPTLAFVAPLAGLCSALTVTALGIGIGAAFPRFDATNQNEIPLSLAGFVYMAAAFGCSLLQMLVLVLPSQRSLLGATIAYWRSGEGLLVLAALALLTCVVTLGALAFGARRLARYEPGMG